LKGEKMPPGKDPKRETAPKAARSKTKKSDGLLLGVPPILQAHLSLLESSLNPPLGYPPQLDEWLRTSLPVIEECVPTLAKTIRLLAPGDDYLHGEKAIAEHHSASIIALMRSYLDDIQKRG
jgi:hypothetical protein